MPSTSRHLYELVTLVGDLRARYGSDDDLVTQIHSEIATCEACELERQAWLAAHGTLASPFEHQSHVNSSA
jgi:hypothetical protein